MIELMLVALLSWAVGMLTGYGLAVRRMEERAERRRQLKKRLKWSE
ncbi:MAG: hypothetical protein ACYC4L_17940 [Chloroflexota bacterium]